MRSTKTDPFPAGPTPLEPAIQSDGKGGAKISAFLVCHDHCLGHNRGKEWTAAQWMKDQRMAVYNKHNTAWAGWPLSCTPATLWGKRGGQPGHEHGLHGQLQHGHLQRFVFESSFLNRYDLTL